jgi:hypothetical protein
MGSFAEYYKLVWTSTGSLEICKVIRNEYQIQSDCSFRYNVRILIPRVDNTEANYN